MRQAAKARRQRLIAMPKGPQGQKRPADVVGNAVHIMKIATGEANGLSSRPPWLKLDHAYERVDVLSLLR